MYNTSLYDRKSYKTFIDDSYAVVANSLIITITIMIFINRNDAFLSYSGFCSLSKPELFGCKCHLRNTSFMSSFD